jgi:hypothetical protein
MKRAGGHIVGAIAVTWVGGVVLTAGAAATDAEGTAGTAPAASTASREWLPLGLQSFEPSALGHQKNNDDVAYYNIKLSVKFPLMPNTTKNWGEGNNRFFFAFTGVLGFYVDTRNSGPVVGKEYNPQLFWEHRVTCNADQFNPAQSVGQANHDTRYPRYDCYFMLGYNHDSNGQIINSLDQYVQTQHSQGTEAANDAISRGWDYLGLTGKYVVPLSSTMNRLSLYPSLKFFLSDGLLQGEPEELHDWEHPSDGKPRKEVDGIGLLAKYQRHINWNFIGDGKVAIRYSTGYQVPFRYSTVRIEAGIQVLQLPIVVWTQKGYMSDLSQYYRNVTGYGLEIEIGAF